MDSRCLIGTWCQCHPVREVRTRCCVLLCCVVLCCVVWFIKYILHFIIRHYVFFIALALVFSVRVRYSYFPFLSYSGLCPELQNLFAMTMTSSDHLPFPMREAERREGELDMYRGNGRESIDIEALRDGSVQGVSKLPLLSLPRMSCIEMSTMKPMNEIRNLIMRVARS